MNRTLLVITDKPQRYKELFHPNWVPWVQKHAILDKSILRYVTPLKSRKVL